MSHEVLFDHFDRDVEHGRLRALDVALAKFLAEQDSAMADPLLWLSALLSRQLADGNLCLELKTLDSMRDEQDWPRHWRQYQHEAEGLIAQLAASALVANGRTGAPVNAPLVLDGSRFYLRRYWNHERVVAHAIRQRLAQTWPVPTNLAEELDRLFPPSTTAETHPVRDAFGSTETPSRVTEGNSSWTASAPAETPSPNWPKIACALAARGGFTVITGGPGTGKTTTVVRLLGLLQTLQLREHQHPLRIRLAAPTGKAAARLNASISAQIAQLDVDETTRAAIPAEVTTLHRLLGARPDTRRFRHDHANPLHLDVLVIDEASMIDLEMMSAVLVALPPTARLILLGDKDQLSSVEAGAVLGDLCRHADGGYYNSDTAAWLRNVANQDIQPFVGDDARPLDQQVAMLRYSHRFSETSGIGRLARAVKDGDAHSARALLSTSSADLAWLSGSNLHQLADLAIDGNQSNLDEPGDTAKKLGYRHYLERVQLERPCAGSGAEDHDRWARSVLNAFASFQLLCALRQGPHGVGGLNQLIAQGLQTRGLIETTGGWYEGRPVMVTRNDYSLGLANGDVGICLRVPDEAGKPRLAVSFLVNASHGETAGTRIRHVLPSRLGDVITVYAMTVHKSQGSEFEHTALVLPAEFSATLSRELLYTGITRARRWFTLVGSEQAVDDAIAKRTRRHSGLAGCIDRG
jgi:exodeoxyribonuclease V alpha subunit